MKLKCISPGGYQSLTKDKEYRLVREDIPNKLLFVTNDYGNIAGYYTHRFEVITENPLTLKTNTTRDWSFMVPRLVDIDWDLVMDELSYTDPVAIIKAESVLTKKQEKEGAKSETVTYVMIDKSIHRKARICGIIVPNILGGVEVENTTVSRLGDDASVGDIIKWVKLVRAATWPEQHRKVSVVNITIPKVIK